MPLVEFQIKASPPKRLDKALARDVPEEAMVSRTRLGKLIDAGAVKINGEVASNPKSQVREGDEVIIEVVASEPPEHLEPEDIALDIIFEDDDVIVVNKPAGMVVHPAPGTPNGTLVNALMGHFGRGLSSVGGATRPGIVHRIDKDTSGLLVVAKTDAAHLGLAEQFARHSIERAYEAFCYGVPDTNDPRVKGVRGVNFETGNIIKITTQLARHKTDRQRQAVFFDKGRHAVTRIQMLTAYAGTAARVRCTLETGRTHQIRVHMAHIGHGLIGDPVYGGRRKFAAKTFLSHHADVISGFSRQALHAAHLGFDHPITGEFMEFDAPWPTDLEGLAKALENRENSSDALE